MKRFRYLFIVLVYKNIEVLEDFFRTFKLNNAHIIVVNSYYDEASLNKCHEVALNYSADFIPIENKGFGYGNNVGIEYALQHYKFDYLILSNSDIQIENISLLNILDPHKPVVIAPYIHLKTGKLQNPNIPWNNKFLIPTLHYAYKHNSKYLLLISHIYTRLSREIFRLIPALLKKDAYKIFSCHGAFIIFSYEAIEKLNPVFNNDMFLYNEELYLAERCKLLNIPIYYYPNLKVLHLEGASSDAINSIGFKYNKQSFEVLYNWKMKSHKNKQDINEINTNA